MENLINLKSTNGTTVSNFSENVKLTKDKKLLDKPKYKKK